MVPCELGAKPTCAGRPGLLLHVDSDQPDPVCQRRVGQQPPVATDIGGNRAAGQ